MKIPTWVFWAVLIFVGWKLYGNTLATQAASGPPESNPQSSNPPSGTPAPNVFQQMLQSAQDIANSLTTMFSQTSAKTS